jgi:hypothetical protein
MRVISYILFILLLLSGGSSKTYANNSLNHKYKTSLEAITKNHPIKFTNKNHNSILVQDTEFDLEEECDQTHGLKNTNVKKIEFEKFLFSNQFYLLLITHPDLDKILNKSKNFALCCGLQNPIYITLQVLRI